MLDQLHKDPTAASGVQKGDAVPSCADAGLRVQKLEASFCEPLEFAGQIGNFPGQMVKPGAPPVQEAPDAAVFPVRLKEFDRPEEGDAHPLGCDRFEGRSGFTGDPGVDRPGLLNRPDRDGDMMQGMGGETGSEGGR